VGWRECVCVCVCVFMYSSSVVFSATRVMSLRQQEADAHAVLKRWPLPCQPGPRTRGHPTAGYRILIEVRTRAHAHAHTHTHTHTHTCVEAALDNLAYGAC